MSAALKTSPALPALKSAVPLLACCLAGGCFLNPFYDSGRESGRDIASPGISPAPAARLPAVSYPRPAPAAPRPVLVTVDLSTPKSAATTYYRAMAYGDAGAARAAVLGDDLTNRYIDSTTAFSAAVRELYTALAGRFGRDAARANPEFLAQLENFASADVPRSIATGEVRVNGDTATLTLKPVGSFPGNEGAPAIFRRVGSQWKLAMLASRRLDGLQAQEAVEATVDSRRSAERLLLLARNVRSGRYGSIDQVWAGEAPSAAGSLAAGPPAPPRTGSSFATAPPRPGTTMPSEPMPPSMMSLPHPSTPWSASGTTSVETRPAVVPVEPSVPTTVASSAPSLPSIPSIPSIPSAPSLPPAPSVTDVTPPSPPPSPRAVAPLPVPSTPHVFPPAPGETSPAVAAIRQAHQEMVRSKLDKGTDVNAKDLRGRTMLHDAAIAGEDDVVKLLLAQRADVKAIDSQGWTALHWAASGGHASVAKLLLDAGADPNIRDQIGATPLHWAAIFDQADAAALLIDRGADTKGKDIQGKTPLHDAAEHDSLQVASLLISRGASLKAKDEDGYTPLHSVVQHARAALSDLALTGADAAPATNPAAAPLAGSKETRDSILRQSAEMIDLLLANGAEVNERTPRGQTPLHLSAWDDTRDLAALLVAKGADVDAQDSKGRTPLEMARQRGQKEIVQLLAGKSE